MIVNLKFFEEDEAAAFSSDESRKGPAVTNWLKY